MRRKSISSRVRSMMTRKAAAGKTQIAAYRRPSLFLESLEQRAMLSVTTFQQTPGGYSGTQDTVLFSISPTVNFGTDTGISVDQQDLNGERQGLLKFDSIIGDGPGQIPFGSTINSATLTMSVFNDSNSSALVSMYRMRTNWDQNVATWNSFGAIGGVQASEGEAEGLPPDATLFDPSTGIKTFDVATSLRHWASGEPNYGWLFESATTNGWDFNTSEASQTDRPLLTVDYTPPSGNGQFQFLNLTPVSTEGNSGSTVALLQVARLGGTTGAVSVDYHITAGTATAGVDFVDAGPLTLDFAAGETLKTIPITINGDTVLEGSETISVTLSNATGGAAITAGRGAATLAIADDDALINEVLANVSNAADETNREYVELTGTPGASLTGYYFVVFEGEEEENGGAGSGIADLVVDLTGQSFGSNGLLVITGTNWAYTKDAATNQLTTAALDGVSGKIEDSSQTYALVRSPLNPIVQGTDYDTVGAYENANPTAVGAGVGILDQLPVGAQMVDSVGVNEGGGGDRDRVATLQYPGVHVHEPVGNGGDVTPDALTRLFGERNPNTSGAWYDGEINDGTLPAVYAPAPFRNVVTPNGAQITPGAPNILRTISFTGTAVSVDESAGTVTLNVTRSGDDSEAIDVHFATANGTALAGADFASTSGTLHFGIGDSSEDIVIPLLTDSVAEGFETFTVSLSNATSPFQIIAPIATVTINDANVLVQTFQEGVNGYNGTADATLNSIQPDDPFGFTTNVSVDQEVGALTGSDSRPTQALLRFDSLFGAAVNQVPQGSQIFSAFLTLNVTNPTAADAQVRFFRMLQNWDEGTTTWSDPLGSAGSGILNGITPDDVEASAEFDSIVTNPGGSGPVNIPLDLDTFQAWADGSLPNMGWAIISDSGNDWNFASSDAFDPSLAPKLTILYTAPSGQGTFEFSDTGYKVNENGTASITVNRVGGSAGAVDLTYAITPGTASLADITGSATGPVHFDAGQLFATITIPIVNDTTLESNERLNLTLSSTMGEIITRPTAVLTIRDNDFSPTSPTVLLNEIYINSPGNDGGHEFIELSGTAGAGMGSLYLVILDGDVGSGEGTSDLVIDIGPYLNGSSGLSLIQALNTFDFRVPAGVTQIKTSLLDLENVDNDSATYAVLYSPTTSLSTGSFDYDWDNDGSLELPAGAVFVDSIAIKDNGATDQTYGPAANIINSNSNPNLFVADAVSRIRGNTARSSAVAWYQGDLFAAGDDPLVYDAPNHVVGLPSPGTAVTPGEINTGTPAQSPLVSLTNVTPNLPAGTVTLTFNGPISQFLKGGGAPGGVTRKSRVSRLTSKELGVMLSRE